MMFRNGPGRMVATDVTGSSARGGRIDMTHWLTPDGTVACNPRDPEAARRAVHGKLRAVEGQMEPRGLAITCPKCRAVYHRYLKAKRE